MHLPATKANGLIERVDRFMHDHPRYADESNLTARRILNDSESLKHADIGQYYLVRACVRSLYGDYGEAMRLLGVARRYPLAPAWLLSTHMGINANYLYATIAQEVMDEYTATLHTYVPDAGLHMASIGAFQSFNKLFEKANKANLAFADVRQAQRMHEAANLLARLETTDADCAKVIDVAGEELRARSLFWLDASPDLVVDYDMQEVGLTFRVDVRYTEACEMMNGVVHKLMERGLQSIPLTIAFLGTHA